MAETHSPIQYPTVTIDGRLLIVKYSLYAEWMLSQMGVNTQEALATMAAKGVKSLANMMDLWTACVADNYRKAGERPPTAEEWARTISDDQWKECCQAVAAALLKTMRPAVTAPAPSANAAPPPLQ